MFRARRIPCAAFAVVCAVAMLCALAAGPLAAQATLLVPSQYPTIALAIAASQNGDTILVAPGVHAGGFGFLGRQVTVRSEQGPAVTTLLGSSASRVVSFINNETPLAVLDGFTITGGAGGVRCLNASPTIKNCMITGNITMLLEGGGGILTVATPAGVCSPLIMDCTISNNSTYTGGGGILSEVTQTGALSTPVVMRCTIAGNSAFGLSVGCSGGSCQAFLGGGILGSDRNNGGILTMTIEESVIDGNTCGDNGGGLAFVRSTAIVRACRINGNQAGPLQASFVEGGGVYSIGASLTLLSCLICGNGASAGGAVTSIASGQGSQPPTVLRNCTIVGNSASATGGFLKDGIIGATISSCIFWDNAGAEIGQFSPGGTLSVTYSLVDGGWPASPTNLAADPLFVDAAGGDFHLSSVSPCIDAGEPSGFGLGPTDLDGTNRIVNGTVDIGADEFPLPLLPGSGDDLDLYAWADGSGDPLTSVLSAPPGTVLTFRFRSPGGSLTGAQPLLLASLHPTGMPPAPATPLPYLHVDLAAFAVLHGTLAPAPFPAPGLPAAGIEEQLLVPPGFANLTLRAQAFAVTPLAANGFFAASAARDVELP